jgi:environmental stress-induced protein Ves
MIILREADYVAVRWKNGAGMAREICRSPADTAEFDWRLSLASLERSGPFSRFDGYERTLVLVRGAGVELDFGSHGRAGLSRTGQVAGFDGGWETTCALLNGPCTDLSLIVAKERVSSRSRVVHQLSTTTTIATARWSETLVCCLSGSVEIESSAGAKEELTAIDTARCVPADGILTIRPRGTVVADLFVAGLGSLGN